MSQALVALFQCDELRRESWLFLEIFSAAEKFATVEHRRQHSARARATRRLLISAQRKRIFDYRAACLVRDESAPSA